MSTVGAGSACRTRGRRQASGGGPNNAAAPSMAQPAKQQCGKAPLCCCASCVTPPSASSVITRGPLAVQMMVVAPGAAPGPGKAAEAISAWNTNRNAAANAVHRLPVLAPVCIRIPSKAPMVARRIRSKRRVEPCRTLGSAPTAAADARA